MKHLEKREVRSHNKVKIKCVLHVRNNTYYGLCWWVMRTMSVRCELLMIQMTTSVPPTCVRIIQLVLIRLPVSSVHAGRATFRMARNAQVCECLCVVWITLFTMNLVVINTKINKHNKTNTIKNVYQQKHNGQPCIRMCLHTELSTELYEAKTA